MHFYQATEYRENYCCLKFAERWLESEDIFARKLQIGNIVNTKISPFTVGVCCDYHGIGVLSGSFMVVLPVYSSYVCVLSS